MVAYNGYLGPKIDCDLFAGFVVLGDGVSDKSRPRGDVISFLHSYFHNMCAMIYY